MLSRALFSATSTLAARRVAPSVSRAAAIPAFVHVQRKAMSSYQGGDSNITYSGGQATEGQGGFYGSGGARASLTPESEHRPEMIALAGDVDKITQVMKEAETLESLFEREREESKGEVTGRSIEIRSSIKKLMTAPEVTECLGRLEINGEPVWGLSMDERDLVKLARQKVNEC